MITVKNLIKTAALFIIFPVTVFLYINLYSAETRPDIIVYGNEKCGYCKETITWLENQKINFIYRDVELYGTNQEEMFLKLKQAGFTTTAYFPVLDVKGQILMKPDFEDIKKALAGQKINFSGKKIRNTLWRPERNKSLRINFDSIKNTLKDSDITIYDDGSGSGKVLIKGLEKEKIPFSVVELYKLGNAAFFNMSSRLSALGYGNKVIFPVAEVKGEMIMNPSVADVKLLIIEMTEE